jgi:hypothetical protein
VTGSLGPARPAGYARPKAATPLYLPLVPAYAGCTAPNRAHAAPLSHGSCAPPQRESSSLTIGTPDANGRPAQATGFLKSAVVPGDPGTPADEADVRLTLQVTDVRRDPQLDDYTGSLGVSFQVRVTDRRNSAATGPAEAGTVSDAPFAFSVPCAATAASEIGSTCAIDTTADAVMPGVVSEGARAIWAVDDVEVADGGGAVFLRPGVFVP